MLAETFSNTLKRPLFASWQEELATRVAERSRVKQGSGLYDRLQTLSQLPKLTPSQIVLDQDTVSIGATSDIESDDQREQLLKSLQALMPWRKGPFDFFGIFIDTEWRSDWKWQRLSPHINKLGNRRVLDIGCGSGYHGWRMVGAGADYVLGIDPSMPFAIQHAACQHYIQSTKFDFLPLGVEDLPADMGCFDTVFSMGVLYHRRDPMQHLRELHGLLMNNGQLVLETLIIKDDFHLIKDGVFVPTERYAQMRNVWNLPTVDHLLSSLQSSGFNNPRCVDINTTSLEEQRATQWIQSQSLADFLDPKDRSKTIEGLPAPTRAIVVADK